MHFPPRRVRCERLPNSSSDSYPIQESERQGETARERAVLRLRARGGARKCTPLRLSAHGRIEVQSGRGVCSGAGVRVVSIMHIHTEVSDTEPEHLAATLYHT